MTHLEYRDVPPSRHANIYLYCQPPAFETLRIPGLVSRKCTFNVVQELITEGDPALLFPVFLGLGYNNVA